MMDNKEVLIGGVALGALALTYNSKKRDRAWDRRLSLAAGVLGVIRPLAQAGFEHYFVLPQKVEWAQNLATAVGIGGTMVGGGLAAASMPVWGGVVAGVGAVGTLGTLLSRTVL